MGSGRDLGRRLPDRRACPDLDRQGAPAGQAAAANDGKLEGEQGMGASAREIEREIKATRERMDVNLTRLEGRAASDAARYGRIVAVVLGVVALGGAAFLVYRRTRRPTLRDRLDGLSLANLRTLAAAPTGRWKDRLPSVMVRVNEKHDEEPGNLETILRAVAAGQVAKRWRTALPAVDGAV